MFGYGYCAMYRGKPVTDEVKKEIEKRKAEFKEEMQEKKKIVDFVTRKPRYC